MMSWIWESLNIPMYDLSFIQFVLVIVIVALAMGAIWSVMLLLDGIRKRWMG